MNVSQHILFLALTGASSAAVAADGERAPPSPNVFVKKAALDGLTEVEAGKVALSKSQNPEIRSFAQRMVADHGRTNAELTSLAIRKGITAPARLDPDHLALLDSLKNKNGRDFDQAYAEHMNLDHSRAVALFESAAGSNDPDVAQFARKTLPALREHQELAQGLPSGILEIDE